MPAEILEQPDEVLLIDLLNATHLCQTQQGRLTLFGEIDRETDVYPVYIDGGNARDFATILIRQLNDSGDREALLNLLVNTISTRLPRSEHQEQLRRLRTALELQNIHIITGTKGGIGKTLVGLAVACYYLNGYSPKRLLALDSNTTNPDLFRILSYYRYPETTLRVSASRTSAIINEKLHTIRPSEPHFIRGGASTFWDDILQILSLPDYESSKFDVLVDTSQHIGNLTLGRTDILQDINLVRRLPRDLASDWKEIVQAILAEPGRTIYIWIFWTWANFQDTEIEYVTSAISILNHEFGAKVSIIHVLNPSALMLPQIRFSPTVETFEREINKLNRDIGRIKTQYGDSDPEYAKELIRNLNNSINATFKKIATLPEHVSHTIPGMYPLAREATAVSPIAYISQDVFDFKDGIGQFFKSRDETIEKPEDVFLKMYDGIIANCGGRPSNILAISTHNPKLKGYTEVFAQSRPPTMEEMMMNISSIIDDVKEFMPHLTPSASINENQQR